MQSTDKALLQLIHRRLKEGASIEIAGMGSFELDHNRRVTFRPCGDPLVFLGYAKEDLAKVKRLFDQLQKSGFEPWMDCKKLLPGQNWQRAIERTIEISDFFIGCFSKRSTTKRGHFQRELALGLQEATRFPLDQVFFIPVRLDDCRLPRSIEDTTHYVDLFPDWNRGVKKLIAALRRQHSSGNRRAS